MMLWIYVHPRVVPGIFPGRMTRHSTATYLRDRRSVIWGTSILGVSIITFISMGSISDCSRVRNGVDSDHAASYFGGEKEDYDVIKTRTRPHRVESLDGDPAAWTRLYDAAVAGFASDSAYFAVQGLTPTGEPDPAGDNLVDIDNLIDYMIVIFYTGQRDGPVNINANVPKNFFALRPRDGRFGFRFYVHDNEDSLDSSSANVTGNNNTGDRLTYFNPKWLHQRLSSNARYRQRFGDLVHRHFF